MLEGYGPVPGGLGSPFANGKGHYRIIIKEDLYVIEKGTEDFKLTLN